MDPRLHDGIIGGLVGAVIGGLIGGLAALVIAFVKPRQHCPECGELFPRFRMPANLRQTLLGGGTCAKCGCEVDRRGHKVESQ